jgi:hypothetical protein
MIGAEGATIVIFTSGIVGVWVWFRPPAAWRGSIVRRTLGTVYPAKAIILIVQILANL